MGNGMFMSFIAFIGVGGDAVGMGGQRCYWHGDDIMGGQHGGTAWEDSMAGWRGRTAWQDGVGGQHGRMAMLLAWEDG